MSNRVVVVALRASNHRATPPRTVFLPNQAVVLVSLPSRIAAPRTYYEGDGEKGSHGSSGTSLDLAGKGITFP